MSGSAETTTAPASTAAKVSVQHKPSGRLIWLDVAKGLAILWIVLFHAEISISGFGRKSTYFAHYGWTDALDVFFGLGIQGVTVFVAASGFSLTYAAMRRGKRTISPREYPSWLGRRLLQLLPIYWFANLIMFLLYAAGGQAFAEGRSPGLWVASFFGVHGWVPGWFAGIRGPWWFEGLIVQLAILYPLCAWALERLSPWKFLVAAWAVTALARYVCVEYLFQWNQYLQYGVFSACRLFEFAIGMAAARYMWQRARPARVWVVAVIGVAAAAGYLAATVPNEWMGRYVVMPTVASVSICVLTWLIASAVSRARRLSTVLAWCGLMSYPIFLMHGLKAEAQIGLLLKAGVAVTAAIALALMVSGVAQGWLFQKAADACLAGARAVSSALFGGRSSGSGK